MKARIVIILVLVALSGAGCRGPDSQERQGAAESPPPVTPSSKEAGDGNQQQVRVTSRVIPPTEAPWESTVITYAVSKDGAKNWSENAPGKETVRWNPRLPNSRLRP
ncbi:hypothetical protein LCGC14_1878330 [marine sediment metagenome]|uniref:Uncharacterized protein n=1 Tax=marine sediment metagenome TaxID=412755 RepID=A0A0F9G2Z0_9ZZZZ